MHVTCTVNSIFVLSYSAFKTVQLRLDLNEWLERFVAKHAAQMQDVASNVSQLQDSLGTVANAAPAKVVSETDSSDATLTPPTIFALLSEVQHGVYELRERTHNQDAANQELRMRVHGMGAEVARLTQDHHSLSECLPVSSRTLD